MTKITKVDDNHVYYRWEDEIDLDSLGLAEDIVILGDRKCVLYGDSTLVDICKGDYYDDDTQEIVTEDGFLEDETIAYDYDTYEELKKITGKDWDHGELRGYSQGDYADIYYSDKVDQATINELEIWIMGKVSEYKIEDDGDDEYYSYIPHDVEWKGKKEICEYFGFDEKDCVIYEEDGETEVK